MQELIEEIIDIIDSENSGLFAEQRLVEIKKLIKQNIYYGITSRQTSKTD